MDSGKRFALLKVVFVLFLAGLVFFGNVPIFVATYVVLFVFVTARVVLTPGDRSTKAWLIISYIAVVVLQIVMIANFTLGYGVTEGAGYLFRRLLAVGTLLLPVLVSRYVVAGKYGHFHMPSVEDATTIGISSIFSAHEIIKRATLVANDTKKKLCAKNLKEGAIELMRHDSFNYINNGSLNSSYFERAAQSMSDPNIYIIISKTGSPVSEIISIFTQKQYNHASLSFDADLQTIISYNGGERVYPPGLNAEMLEHLQKTDDARILVYSLPCPPEKKQMMLDKIAEINAEGSAYNMIGLFVNRSHKPNIMYCSQFVYTMLHYAEIAHFTKPNSKVVNPTDLVEQDYYKKLTFVKEIKFVS